MKRLLAFFSVFGLVIALAPAVNAALETTWRTDIVAASNDVATGPGGAVYAVGRGPAGTVSWDRGRATVTRLTTAGDVVWSRAWQPHPERPRAFRTNAVAVAVGDNGVVYVVGTVQRFNCEGGGWFIRAYSPNGRLLHAAGTQRAWYCRPPGPQTVRDVAVRGDLVVVATAATGCCGELARVDGYLRGFTTGLRSLWRTNFEPPAPANAAWYDAADSVAIARDGSVYAAGWAAIERSNGETTPAGALLIQKVRHGGTTLWARRPGVPMGYDPAVSLALGSDRMIVGAQLRGGGTWLGQLTLTADPVWHRVWGVAAEIRARIGGVALDATGRIWMVGTRRDLTDNGINVFVRRHGPAGVLVGSLTIDQPARWVRGNAVATLGDAAFAVGTTYVPATGVLISGEVWRVQV